MLMSLARQGKNWLLPSGSSYRRIPVGPLAGCTLPIDFQHQTLQYLGLYEYELRRDFRRLVRPGYRCFDVGGADGYDAFLLAKHSGGAVVCIDCDDAAVTRLRETVLRNGYPVTVVSARIGTGRVEGTKSLDAIAESSFIPDFMKIDIEGAEVDALRGARGILAARRPSLIIETHAEKLEEECMEILLANGYRPRIVDQRWWLPDHRPMAHNRWLVCEGWDTVEAGLGPHDAVEDRASLR